MKKILETVGSFQLLDVESGFLIPADRPCIPPETNFVQTRAGANQLKILASVNDSATDEEFQNFWNESQGNVDLAIESFVAAFPVEPKGNPEPEPEPEPVKKKK